MSRQDFENIREIENDLASQKPRSKKKTNSEHEKVIKRINQIIREANDVSMGGRNQNYIRGGAKTKARYPKVHNRTYQFIDPQTGMTHINQSPSGYDLEHSMYPEGKPVQLDYFGGNYSSTGPKNYLSYAGAGLNGNMSAGCMPCGHKCKNCNNIPVAGNMAGGVRKRKPRSDKGKKRAPNAWHKLVSVVAEEYGLPYNKALTKASQLKKQGYSYEDFM